MSTRSNIRLTYSDGNKVVFYQHCDGDTLSDTLKAALKRGKGRWSDSTYLARIIFSEMIQNDVLGTMGYGIGTHVSEENWFTLDVNLADQTVEWTDQSGKSYCMEYDKFID